MEQTIYLWLACACFVFWCVGAYNRMVRLRARAIDVLSALEVQIRAAIAMLQMRLGNDQRPYSVNGFDECRFQLLQSLQLAEAIWGAPRKHRLSPEVQRKRKESWGQLEDAWNAWLATPPDLAGPRVPEPLRHEWETHVYKINTIKDALNRALEAYNDAVGEPPASWLAQTFGLQPCPSI
jgi:LemA protein